MKKTIDTYISELLFLHDCVIIPEFGGFVGNNKSAVLNKNTNTIYPPSKDILFNKNLRKNDGLLINHIANSEVISNKKSKRTFGLNLQKKRFYLPEEDRWVTLKVTAQVVKTINKKGIAAVIKDARAKGFLNK